MKCIIFTKRSERFPGKQMFPIDGIPLIQIIVKKLLDSGVCGIPVIFTKDPDIKADDALIIRDTTDGIIIDSLLSAIKSYGEFFAFAGDMPLIDTAFVAEMIERYREKPLFPVHENGMIEPLHGIYNKTLERGMADYISGGGRSITGFLNRSDIDTIRIEKKYEYSFINLNYPDDLRLLDPYRDKLHR